MKKVLLTIDDGPTKTTPALCNFLSKNNIGAIMFCVGNLLLQNKNESNTILDNDFIMGNHSFTHPNFTHVPLSMGFDEVRKTKNVIKKYCSNAEKKSFNLFRFPYGMFSRFPLFKKRIYNKLLKKEGFIPFGQDFHWGWNTNFKDGHGEETNFNRRFESISLKISEIISKDILLIHDSLENMQSGFTYEVIEKIKDNGISFYSNNEIQTMLKLKLLPRDL